MKILHVVSCCLLLALCVVESAVINVKDVVGGQVKITCSYSWAENNEKYFCKRECYHRDRLVQTKGNKHYIEKERYTIEDLSKGVFYVTIKDLRKSDSGTYWCGVGRYGPDTYQEVHLTVTDATTSKPSAVTPRPHQNLSATSPNISTTFLASGDISGPPSSRADGPPSDYSPGAEQSQTAGLMVWTSAGLEVMVTVLGLVLLLFYRQRRGTRRTPPPPPVSSNTQPDPTGEVDCVYEEIREADRQTDTLPVVISSVYFTVSASSTSSATDPGQRQCSIANKVTSGMKKSSL